MNEKLFDHLSEMMPQVTGFIFPNEIQTQWSVLIVVYPYVTGLVAGAFILASLVKVFDVKEVQPTYRLAMLTALAFLLAAPLPLLLHLGHPERFYEILIAPNLSSAMAVFGFVYVWYLMVVLLVELWFDYRRDMVMWSKSSPFPLNWIYRTLTLFSDDISEEAVRFDKKAVRIITVIGIPSAFLLHGYVGFIFGSIKANPFWSSVLMPIVFLFSAIVSGMALVILLYMIIVLARGEELDMACLDRVTSFLFYAVIVDFTLETLDFIHRVYESEESIRILTDLVTNRLFISLFILQVLLGMVFPLAIMSMVKIFNYKPDLRKLLYFVSVLLIQLGIFSTRWNIVIGGQLFSKSFRGLTAYNMELLGMDGLVMALALLALPFGILFFLYRMFPPWEPAPESKPAAPAEA